MFFLFNVPQPFRNIWGLFFLAWFWESYHLKFNLDKSLSGAWWWAFKTQHCIDFVRNDGMMSILMNLKVVIIWECFLKCLKWSAWYVHKCFTAYAKWVLGLRRLRHCNLGTLGTLGCRMATKWRSQHGHPLARCSWGRPQLLHQPLAHQRLAPMDGRKRHHRSCHGEAGWSCIGCLRSCQNYAGSVAVQECFPHFAVPGVGGPNRKTPWWKSSCAVLPGDRRAAKGLPLASGRVFVVEWKLLKLAAWIE